MRAIEAKSFSGYVLVHVVNLVVPRRKDIRSARIKR